MGLNYISSSFFYFICKKDEPKVYYFNPNNQSVSAIKHSSIKNIKDAKAIKYTASKNGYYIAVLNKKMSVLVKGNVKYCAFLLNNKNKNDTISIEADFLDNTSKNIEFKKIIDNIYFADLSRITNLGWFNLKGLPTINPTGFKIGSSGVITISDLHNDFIKKEMIKNSKKSQPITLHVKNDDISTDKSGPKIEYNIKSNSIQTNIKNTKFKTFED